MRNMRSLSPPSTSVVWLSVTNSIPLASAKGANSVSNTVAIDSERNGRICSFSLWISSLKNSSSSVVMEAMRLADSRTVNMLRTRSSRASSRSRSSALPLIAVRAVRISWLTVCIRL